MTLPAKKFYTPLEYLKLEEATEAKHEYHQGIITQMAGGTNSHHLVISNTVSILNQRLKRTTCLVYPSELRVQVKESGLYTYSDVTVVCGKPEFASGRTATLLNPTIIVEVMSPSTRAYDRGKKFDLYRPLKSLQAYILIDPDQPYVDYFQRETDGIWQLFEHRKLSDKVRLHTPQVTIALKDLYDKVDWAMSQRTPSKKRK